MHLWQGAGCTVELAACQAGVGAVRTLSGRMLVVDLIICMSHGCMGHASIAQMWTGNAGFIADFAEGITLEISSKDHAR
jgi:hypothetical protein